MSSVVRWDSQEGWQDWINESASGRLPRLIGSALKLPFARIPHLGIGDLSTQYIARWSWGQRQRTEFNQPYLLESDLKDDDDTLNPIVGGNLEHTTTISGTVELSEYGFNTINRNSYLNSSGYADFNYPHDDNPAYISCWIKSHIVDYSSGLGIIAAGHDGVEADGLYFAIIVDSDNTLKAVKVKSGTNTVVSPVGGEVVIDTNWHHLLFAVNERGVGEGAVIFVVDNEWGNGPSPNSEYSDSLTAGAITRFDIGSSSISGESSYGFAGIIDELVVANWTPEDSSIRNIINNATTNLSQEDVFGTGAYTKSYRFESNVFVSPVIDTERENSLFTGVYADYENPNGSSVQFSFRASDTEFDRDTTSPPWTGFTAPNKVLHATAAGHEELGIWLRGRYQQVRMKLNPSSTASLLQLDTPIVNIVEISTGVSTKVLGATKSSYEPGTILGQVFNYDENKTIDKISLNLTVNTEDRQTFIVGQDGHIVFQAANWQESRDDWAFQPTPHWISIDDPGYDDPGYGSGWETSGTSIRNTRQIEGWTTVDNALSNAPYLKYQIFFPSGGLYQLWGYGLVNDDGIFYTFDDDETNLRRLTLGDSELVPKWTRFGSFFLEEGGLHTFSVYLADRNITVLDQWMFTQNPGIDAELESDSYVLPQPNSTAPFNTAVRLRSLYQGELDDLIIPVASPSYNVTMWLPSRIIAASGTFNYEVVNDSGTTGVSFVGGVSIEFWQIGGTSKYFAAWDYIKAD